MEPPFDLWHLAFANVIQGRAPPNFGERGGAGRVPAVSHRPAEQGEATRWLQQWMRETKMKQPDMEELPGFEELFQKTIEKMPIEKRLAGLSPEQVLGAFAPEQVILALPLEVLRVLPEEYLRSLPAEVQERVRERLRGAAH